MRLLLDTHVFLWFATGDRRLPAAWRETMQDPLNEVFVSVVSLWEATVKHQIGKLPLPHPPGTYLPRLRTIHRFASLPLDEESVARLAGLPQAHRDPFDRMLICQAIEHHLTLVTSDEIMKQYPVPTLE